MDNNNKLGICIPTYNRDKYIDKCLDSITREFRDYEYPIYISDNCSDDNTEFIVRSYQKRFENITYFKNHSNLGMYKNILNVIKLARTEYVWLLGDDDAIQKDSLERVVKAIGQGYDYVVLNSVPYDSNLEMNKGKKIINCTQDMEFKVGESQKLLINLKKSGYHGYMSSMVIRTQLLHDLIPKYYDESFSMYNCIWLPLAMFYEAIKDKTGIFLCNPIILNRDNTRPSGKNYWNYIYVDRIKAINYLVTQDYSLSALRIAADFSIRETFIVAVLSKRQSQDIKLFADFVKNDSFIPLRIKLTIVFIDIIPIAFITNLYKILDHIR